MGQPHKSRRHSFLFLRSVFACLRLVSSTSRTTASPQRRSTYRRSQRLRSRFLVVPFSILSRFAHSFAIILRAGVPMTTGLTLVADAVDNSYMREKIMAMRSSIESGESLLRSSVTSKLFTPLVLQMVAVGEETGRVDELLAEVGDYYEREVDYELSTLTARIEPIMIAIVAAMVLVLALGIFSPMWDMMSAFQGK